jgi:F-type H+-transporting ATPase subunit a
VIALEFPPLSELLVWRDIFPGVNKIAVIAVLAVLITVAIFAMAGGGSPLEAPKGIKNLGETIIEFVQENVVRPTMGNAGLAWTPLLLTLFMFIFLNNITGIIPTFQMPANARIGAPLTMAALVWVIYIAVGIKHQGAGYFGHLLWPAGVPVALKPLVGLIEFVSTIIVRPASLVIRLLANMMAGHILLFTFALMTKELWHNTHFDASVLYAPISLLTIFMLIFLTAFEVLVSFLQAYIFSMLTGVYIGSSMEGHGGDAHADPL